MSAWEVVYQREVRSISQNRKILISFSIPHSNPLQLEEPEMEFPIFRVTRTGLIMIVRLKATARGGLRRSLRCRFGKDALFHDSDSYLEASKGEGSYRDFALSGPLLISTPIDP